MSENTSAQLPQPAKKMRDSNMELARIVAMVSIVVYHFVRIGLFDWSMPEDGSISENVILYSSFFLMFGADLFALISGYYGIKLSWKSLVSLWLLCVFYNLLSVLSKQDFSISSILHSFFISGRTQQWYFAAYFWLLLFSPILNAGIRSLSLNQLRVASIISFLLCGFSGWFLESVNRDGLNLIQLIAIYIIGGWLSKESFFGNVKPCSFFGGYFLSCVLGIAFILCYRERGLGLLFQHNNPFVIASAVCLLQFFIKIHVESKVINWIALSMPGFLLLTDHSISGILYPWIRNTYIQNGMNIRCVVIIALCLVVCFVSSIIVETIRRTIARPLIDRLSIFLSRFSIKLMAYANSNRI